MSPRTKRLSPSNWLERDPRMEAFVHPDAIAGERQNLDRRDWLSFFLEPELQDHVPESIRDLFEVARGALFYGYFYYPLYALGSDQLFRVAEGAVRTRWKALGLPSQRARFKTMIEDLISNGLMDETSRERWDSIRRMRNTLSHPTSQFIFMPGQALSILGNIAECINGLFPVRELPHRVE